MNHQKDLSSIKTGGGRLSIPNSHPGKKGLINSERGGAHIY
jgi:hypothetical protein